MKNKFFALFIIFAFSLSAFGQNFARSKSKNSQTNQLVSLLPASEGVMTVDVQRLFNQSLPQILSANPVMLEEVIAQINEVKSRTGIDLKQFDHIAAGVMTKQLADKKFDVEPVVLARGKFSAENSLTTAKAAFNGKYREEKIGERTVYIFSTKETIEANKPAAKNSMIQKMLDKLISGLPAELAVTKYDENTLAFGSLPRVRETFESKIRVDKDVLNLVNRKPNSLVSFGAKLPNGMSKFIDLDDDELGKNLDAIRFLSGSMDVIGTNTSVLLTARTLKANEAQSLKETLESLQGAFSLILLSSKGDDKKVYGKMLENAKITRTGAEVMLDLQVPQTDIDILLGKH